jgi:protein-S-isoprenylcysteine O-methyltransferase Ste14
MKPKTDTSGLKRKILLLFPLGIIVTGLILFLPAGSLGYWQAWLFMGILFIPFLFAGSYLVRHDPELLERRMRFKEKELQEKKIIKISQLLFFIGFLIPGFDYRFGWSNVPIWLVLISDIIILSGYILVFFVFKANSYTSRIVEVEKNQKLITTGPYAVIRHPMYLGVMAMFLFIPLALGSYLALIFFVPELFLIIFRIFDEERVLSKGLKGYKEYMQKTRYRLVPGIW